jgi:dolichyl-phosphate-mannose-protein mannosyltransferase
VSKKSRNQAKVERKPFFESLRANRKMAWLFGFVLLFCFFSKLPRLTTPSIFYFDEVYHGYTSTLYLHGEKQAYDPWAHPPKNMGIEWTHPPLSKLIMAGAMKIFGENSFGWRIGSVVFGTAATAATAILAFELFGSLSIALLAMTLMSVETLIFAQSRIAMNDAYFVFFMIFAMIFYVRWRRAPDKNTALYLTGLGLGLALATKWTALYLFVIIAFDLGGDLVWKGRYPSGASFIHMVIAFCFVPFITYFLSYSQLLYLGGGWTEFVNLQSEMWRYHTGQTSTSGYSSTPLQWIFNLKPVWYSVDYSVPGSVGHIYNIGNYVIFYFGLFAVWSLMFREKNQEFTWDKWFVCLIYFFMWAPWIFSPRIMFFYHYTPALPALCIILARWLDSMLKDNNLQHRRTAIGVIVAACLWMPLAYPILTQIRIPTVIGNSIYSAFAPRN